MGDPGTISVNALARRVAGKVKVTLWLHIPEGAHVEPHQPSEPTLIPTVVEFTDLEVSSVSYPQPVKKDLGLPGPPLIVYQGSIRITAEGRARETRRMLHGTIRYQPCVGGACLPPREQPWQASIQPGDPAGGGEAQPATAG